MKLWSKEALMIGGVYSVLSTPFLILKTPLTEQIGMFYFRHSFLVYSCFIGLSLLY